MWFFRRSSSALPAMLGGAAVALTSAGCGGSDASGFLVVAPISVSLSASTVVVPRDGTPARIQITIVSTSETALVNFVGMPAGIDAAYAATDTNPSGSLTFMATEKVSAGTYMPIITVNSAGQTAMVAFTLVVPAG